MYFRLFILAVGLFFFLFSFFFSIFFFIWNRPKYNISGSNRFSLSLSKYPLLVCWEPVDIWTVDPVMWNRFQFPFAVSRVGDKEPPSLCYDPNTSTPARYRPTRSAYNLCWNTAKSLLSDSANSIPYERLRLKPLWVHWRLSCLLTGLNRSNRVCKGSTGCVQ